MDSEAVATQDRITYDCRHQVAEPQPKDERPRKGDPTTAAIDSPFDASRRAIGAQAERRWSLEASGHRRLEEPRQTMVTPTP